MTITKHQTEIIRLIKEDGYTLKYQKEFPKSGSWWLSRPLIGGYFLSKNVLKSSAENLLKNKLIQKQSVDKYKHHYYILTEVANSNLN